MNLIRDNILNSLSHEAIVKALFETYESIYAVDVETSAYQCFYESTSYNTLNLQKSGEDFFERLKEDIPVAIFKDDQEYVKNRLSRDLILKELSREKFCSFVYRLMIDGKPLYHKFRATTDIVDGRLHLLIGVRNVDEAFRQDKAQAEALSAMHSKEINHLEAILASAEYYLEINLSRDRILEASPHVIAEGMTYSGTYSDFIRKHADQMVVENKDKFLEISDKDYLIRSFSKNEKRASVSFTAKYPNGQTQPCRMVFYLYKDAASTDVMSFCVLYDLTEQQKKEKEIAELEQELQMSRLRNFTSQMQPHFLYNTLGSIQEIVLEDPEYAARLIGDFSIHLRSCIRAMSNDSPIPFEQELANIKAYVNIERMRFGDKLKVLYDIQTEGFKILPLSIQPIVENAIRHGIYQRGEKGGAVIIRAIETDDAFQVIVEDSGVGFDVDAYSFTNRYRKTDSTGLKNLSFRLSRMMHAEVNIISKVGKGTVVTVTLGKEHAI